MTGTRNDGSRTTEAAPDSRGNTNATTTMTTDVLIVGAGPTGLALAATLAHRSVPTIVVDRAARGANTSRAAVIHARTLDLLDRIGLARPLIDQGLIVPRFSVRHGEKVLMRIDFSQIRSAHPYTLMLPQSTTEQVIADSLPDTAPLLREHSIDTLVQQDGGVSAVVSRQGGGVTEIQARWAVGCDGMHSKVRELAHIDFAGDRYPQTFLLADVRMDWPLPRTEVELFFAPSGLMVVASLPGDRFRIVATTGLTSTENAPDGPIGRGVIQSLLAERGPTHPSAQVQEVIWSSHFTVHHRLAGHYRRGQVFLAGDAAHVHSPAGGQGMNLGIQDAVDLGVMLADEMDGLPVDLDGYEARRRPQAERVVRLTDRMTRAATAEHHVVGAVRDLVITAAGHIPAIPRGLARQLSGVNGTR